MLSPKSDLPNRRRVWGALSGLFVDNNLQSTRDDRVAVLAKSPYSLEELEEILVHEVLPICRWGSDYSSEPHSPIDHAWLESRILRRAKSPFGLLRRLNVGAFSSTVSEEWAATKREVLLARSRSTANGVA